MILDCDDADGIPGKDGDEADAMCEAGYPEVLRRQADESTPEPVQSAVDSDSCQEADARRTVTPGRTPTYCRASVDQGIRRTPSDPAGFPRDRGLPA